MEFSGSINSRLPHMENSIFSVMSKLALENNAINLSQGFPDFDCSPELLDLVHQALLEGKNQYAPMPGLLMLRETISEKIADLHNAFYNPETEVNITAGATQAIFSAILSVVNPLDEVIVIEPAYDCYVPAILLAGGKPISFETSYPNFKVDWEKLGSLINEKTKLIIVNNPNNPGCSVFTKDDLESLNQITSNSGIIILSDEVYEHITFNSDHLSLASHGELRERAFIVSSFGKTFHVTGWKVGYIVAPERLITEFRKVHQFNVFSVNTPMQVAINHFLRNKDNYHDLGGFYKAKRDYFLEIMSQTPFEPLPCEGTYFQLMCYKNISSMADVDFAFWLTKTVGVASIPLSPFYLSGRDNHVVRFCFAKKEETLNLAGEKFYSFFSKV
jgi:methionine aminotransferase